MKLSRILFLSLVLVVIGNAFAITISYAAQSIASPTGQESFPSYNPIALPITSSDPLKAMPIGVGSVASGGDTISLQVDLDQFSGPVDIYFACYAPSIDPQNFYILTSNYTTMPLSLMDPLHEGLTPWKRDVSSGINESLASKLGSIPISSLPTGTYTFSLLVTPAGRLDSYYLWSTAIYVADNVLPITVNGSLCSANSYPNKPCVSVTVCTPGTATCQTINDILLDTGSYGLRIFKQALNVILPQAVGNSGSLAECVQFGDGSSDWGPVQIADLILGNEPGIQVPIQVIDSAFGSLPKTCRNADLNPAEAGFNGILGVGLFIQDCGSACSNIADNGMYYGCNGSGCSGTAVALSSQVQNPVALLPKDNNGVIVQMPTVTPGGMTSVNGSLVLGIGTQPNNIPSAVQTYPADEYGEFITIFEGISYGGSFIDTGSNGLFFPSTSTSQLPQCRASDSDWFCPTTAINLSAINTDASGSLSGTVSFQIGNFTSLMNSPDYVFVEIGGNSTGGFDWGLPFHFGRNIFVGFEESSSSLGNGPYWAY